MDNRLFALAGLPRGDPGWYWLNVLSKCCQVYQALRAFASRPNLAGVDGRMQAFYHAAKGNEGTPEARDDSNTVRQAWGSLLVCIAARHGRYGR